MNIIDRLHTCWHVLFHGKLPTTKEPTERIRPVLPVCPNGWFGAQRLNALSRQRDEFNRQIGRELPTPTQSDHESF